MGLLDGIVKKVAGGQGSVHTRDRAKEKFLTIEEAGNVIKERKRSDLLAEAKKKKKPISVATQEDRYRFFKYCVSLLPKNNTKARILLTMIYAYKPKMGNLVYSYIATHLQKNGFGLTTANDVRKEELIAIQRVKDAVEKTKREKVPLIGGAR